MSHEVMSRDGPARQPPPGTEWHDLFAANPSLEPTSYKSLDDLDDDDAGGGEPGLAFLHQLFWDEIRQWTRNDDAQMTHIIHPDLPGGGGGGGGAAKVFIGGMNHALDEDTLARNDVRAVVTIHPKDSLAWDRKDPSGGLRRFFDDGGEDCCGGDDGRGVQRGERGGSRSVVERALIIPLEDNANSNLIDHFGETNDFIRRHLEAEGGSGNILIHCKSGRSRSVAVLIAYLQQKFAGELLQEQQQQQQQRLGDNNNNNNKKKEEARERMREYREAATEAIRAQRLPVVVIMERFQDLLALYDLQLIGHPDYQKQRRALFPSPVSAVRMMPSRVDSILKEPPQQQQQQQQQRRTPGTAAVTNTSSNGISNNGISSNGISSGGGGGGRSKVVQTRGGAAVLKICVAGAFFKHNQKPTEAVVHQFFEINEAYFYELEGLEYNKGRSYVGSRHACPGLVGFCLGYATGEYGLALPSHTLEHAVLATSSRRE